MDSVCVAGHYYNYSHVLVDWMSDYMNGLDYSGLLHIVEFEGTILLAITQTKMTEISHESV